MEPCRTPFRPALTSRVTAPCWSWSRSHQRTPGGLDQSVADRSARTAAGADVGPIPLASDDGFFIAEPLGVDEGPYRPIVHLQIAFRQLANQAAECENTAAGRASLVAFADGRCCTGHGPRRWSSAIVSARRPPSRGWPQSIHSDSRLAALKSDAHAWREALAMPPRHERRSFLITSGEAPRTQGAHPSGTRPLREPSPFRLFGPPILQRRQTGSGCSWSRLPLLRDRTSEAARRARAINVECQRRRLMP